MFIYLRLIEFFFSQIDTIGIQIGLPANMTRKNYIDEYYLPFNAVQNDFFANIVSGHTFIRETLQSRLKNPQEEFKYDYIYYNFFLRCLYLFECGIMIFFCRWLNDMTSQPVTVSYNVAAHKIIVPLTVLQFPYFEKDYPQ